MPFGIDPKQVAQVLADVAAIKGRLDVMDAKLDAIRANTEKIIALLEPPKAVSA